MESALQKRLLYRSSGRSDSLCRMSGFYSDRRWINDLDIVNELWGHSGCINALSWSQDGSLLASGSDDKHINIYTYQRGDGERAFFKDTTIHTGHRANIFSVKFMPHSGDRTIVSCAGDHQVRVFDVEYSAATNSSSGDGQRGSTNRETRSLHHEHANCRVYRSHTNRVKRILTESSPFYFMTCSEDGEVRRWDMREPSSSYPSPRDEVPFGVNSDDYPSRIPPPLISYRRQGLQLNTMSCSPSQPHYIALGGSHLHCFLHDGRMAGRDLLSENGVPYQYSRQAVSTHQDDKMDETTRCVRRFAPYGSESETNLGKNNCHITACKISNYNPNEMIVSWSGDHIYSFDIIHGQDAREAYTARIASVTPQLKRKRLSAPSTPLTRSRTRQRRNLGSARGAGHHSMDHTSREASNIALPDQSSGEDYRASNLTADETTALTIARNLCKIRGLLFGQRIIEDPGTTGSLFETIENMATMYYGEIRAALQSWRYPMNPSSEQVGRQMEMREHRQSAYRFVQIARDLANTYRLRYDSSVTANLSNYPDVELERGPRDDESHFCYQFLRAIIMFARDGRNGLVTSFKKSSRARNSKLFPIPADAQDAAIEEHIIPHLSELASPSPLVNINANQFEHAWARALFQTEHDSVNAFAELLGQPAYTSDMRAQSTPFLPEQDEEAFRFWLLKVARSLLMKATQDLHFEALNRAFGGAYWPRDVLINLTQSAADEDNTEPDQELNGGCELTPEESTIAWGPSEDHTSAGEENVSSGQSHHFVSPRTNRRSSGETPAPSSSQSGGEVDLSQSLGYDDREEAFFSSGSFEGSEDFESHQSDWRSNGENDDGDLGDDDDDSDDADYDGSSDDEDEGSESSSMFGLFSSQRSRFHARPIEQHAPCLSHIKKYQGHCNVETVKDVNFIGQNDEYVVSGSDSGHLIIWDRKTTELVNILLGDHEVVNVIQGHPYEPMLAVSGIDDTVKIFSPDRYAQRLAHLRPRERPLDTENHIPWTLDIPDTFNERRPAIVGSYNGDPDLDTTDTNGTTSEEDAEDSQQESQPALNPLEDGNAFDSDDEDPYHGPGPGLESRKCMQDKDGILRYNERVRARLNQALISVGIVL